MTLSWPEAAAFSQVSRSPGDKRTYGYPKDIQHGEFFAATLEDNVLLTYVILSHKLAVTDEGRGRLRVRWAFRDHLGIYRQEGDRLLIAYRDDFRGRPASFWPAAGEGHHLLILRRVRPAK